MTHAEDLDPNAARDQLLRAHREPIAATIDCADAVAEGFETRVAGRPATVDARSIRAPLRATLDRAGLLASYPELLQTAVSGAGGTLETAPVAAPPYVAISSTGPVLRATLGDVRLVVRLSVFEVDDGTFRRTGSTPVDVLSIDAVDCRGRSDVSHSNTSRSTGNGSDGHRSREG